MREIMHFNSEKEKIAYLKGNFTEITPVEAKKPTEEVKEEEEAPAKKKASKKGKEDGEVQAE